MLAEAGFDSALDTAFAGDVPDASLLDPWHGRRGYDNALDRSFADDVDASLLDPWHGRRVLAEAGFDVAHPFDTALLAGEPALASLVDPDLRAGLLIGNSRALWPVFLAALEADPALAAASEPLERYTEATIERAFPGERVWFSHRRYTASGRANEGTASGRAHERTASGRAHERTASGRANERTASGRVHERTASGRAHERTASGRANEGTASGRVHERTASGRAHEGTASGRANERTAEQPAFIPFQRVAVLAGLGALAPTGLVIHPRLGPWFALRALVIRAGEPPPHVTLAPYRCTGTCEARLAEALASGGDWRAWLAVRDACVVGRDARYSDDQIAYHYTKNRGFLR